ncbi:recombinase family protein [Acuticoccus mangrovi]|uniref:recombinase family protein n=1 Tax=Acuticoccus mangrovi TaxID=2796142 RepID=UPI0038CBF7D7
MFREKASGAQRDRPQFAAAIDYLRDGNTLVVWNLHRLARSMKQQLIETVEGLEAQGSAFSLSPRRSTPRHRAASSRSTSSGPGRVRPLDHP